MKKITAIYAAPAPRNPIARALADSLFRSKTVPSKKAYRRRNRGMRGDE